MAKIKDTSAVKPNKKSLQHEVENLLTSALSGIVNSAALPKGFHKKIKKAGKLLTKGILEMKKPVVKVAEPPKKSILKKSTPKKATKKAASK